MVKGLETEKAGQTDLKETDMLSDDDRGLFRLSLVSMRPHADAHSSCPGSKYGSFFKLH